MSFDILSRHRSKLMAFAMLWIALYHASLIVDDKLFRFVQINGYGGVDIFLFLFGLGMVYSLSQRNNLKLFFLDRVKRIYPIVLPVLLLCCFLYGYGTRQSILFVLMLDFWSSGNVTLWYFPALFAFVLMAPMAFSLTENRKIGFFVILILSAVSFLFFMHCRQMIFASRLPVYFLGFYFGDFSLKKKKITPMWWLVSLAGIVVGTFVLYWCYHHYGDLMWGLGLYWYPFVFITPGLCLLIAGFFELLETKLNIGGKIFSFLGKITMEIYLFHELIVKLVDYYIYYAWDPHGYFRNTLSFLISFGIAVVYHCVVSKTIKKFVKKA